MTTDKQSAVPEDPAQRLHAALEDASGRFTELASLFEAIWTVDDAGDAQNLAMAGKRLASAASEALDAARRLA